MDSLRSPMDEGKRRILSELRADLQAEEILEKQKARETLEKQRTELVQRGVPSGNVDHQNYFHLLREKALPASGQPQPGATAVAPTASVFFIPPLVDIACRSIARSFRDRPSFGNLPASLVKRVVDYLPTDLPLEISVPLVHEDSYWDRCYNEKWTRGEQGLESLSFMKKQVYLEKIVEAFLERDSPVKEELVVTPLLKMLRVCSPYIYNMRIKQLRSHLDLRILFNNLSHLKGLSLTYGLRNVGLDFSLDMLGMHNRDCICLARCLQSTKHLTSLQLRENLLDDDKMRAILSGLVKNQSVTELDISHNKIGDTGFSALCKLLQSSTCRISTLDVSDNRLQTESGEAIRDALSSPACSLTRISMRLNQLGERGGQHLAAGVKSSSRLQTLDISCNHLGLDTARALSDAVRGKLNLLRIDISGNKNVGLQGGKHLLDGVLDCGGLREFDCRMCSVSPEDMAVIETTLKGRASRS